MPPCCSCSTPTRGPQSVRAAGARRRRAGDCCSTRAAPDAQRRRALRRRRDLASARSLRRARRQSRRGQVGRMMRFRHAHALRRRAARARSRRRFRLWAPASSTAPARARGRQRPVLPMAAGRRRLVRARNRGCRRRHALSLRAGRTGCACPTRRRAPSPTTSTGRARSSTRAAYRLAASATGAAGRGTRPCSTSCMSALQRGGTFAGVRRRLDHLADLGVTARRADAGRRFPRPRNWGYDGVLPFAPDRRLWHARRR